MPGILKPGLVCPHCGKPVMAVFNEWQRANDLHLREYIHHGDADVGEAGHCRVRMTYAEGLRVAEAEGADPVVEVAVVDDGATPEA